MLTGDSRGTAEAIGRRLGIDEIHDPATGFRGFWLHDPDVPDELRTDLHRAGHVLLDEPRASEVKAEYQDLMKRRRAWLAENGMYRDEFEHASCGVGLVVAIDGKPSRKVVENGIDALKAVWHRGAVDADGKTGDGAGIHLQIPQDFFREHVARTGHEPGEDRVVGEAGTEPPDDPDQSVGQRLLAGLPPGRAGAGLRRGTPPGR